MVCACVSEREREREYSKLVECNQSSVYVIQGSCMCMSFVR
jgi:hypothetical protein